MTALVFAQSLAGAIHPGVAHAVAAARAYGDVDVVVFSNAPLPVPIAGVRRLYQVYDPTLQYPTVDSLIPTLGALADEYSHFFAAHTNLGRAVMARLAARLRILLLTDVTALDGATITRPCYAGAVQEVLQATADRIAMTVRTTSFEAAPAGQPGETLVQPFVRGVIESSAMHTDAPASTRPDLTTAKLVVAGGRGLGSQENFALVEQLADALGGAVGASRAAVDAGFVPNDLQIGQTGKTVAPEVYIALGISGAVQHLAGIRGAKTIIAVNKDPEAPIFKVADYGLVGDIFDVVPQLLSELKK